MSSKERRYSIRYKIDVEEKEEGFSAKDITNGYGIADEILFIPIYREENEKLKVHLLQIKGRPISKEESILAWIEMGKQIIENTFFDKYLLLPYISKFIENAETIIQDVDANPDKYKSILEIP